MNNNEKILIIKPNIVLQGENFVNKIKKEIENKIGKIEGFVEKQMTIKDANYLYRHLEKVDLLDGLLDNIKSFIQKTPIIFLKVKTNKNFEEIRKIIGTKKLEDGSLRKMFHKEGDESFENSIHFADNENQMINEIKFFEIYKNLNEINKSKINKKMI